MTKRNVAIGRIAEVEHGLYIKNHVDSMMGWIAMLDIGAES